MDVMEKEEEVSLKGGAVSFDPSVGGSSGDTRKASKKAKRSEARLNAPEAPLSDHRGNKMQRDKSSNAAGAEK